MVKLEDVFDRPYHDDEAIAAIIVMASELGDSWCKCDSAKDYAGLAKFVLPSDVGAASGFVLGWFGPSYVSFAPGNFFLGGKPIGYAVLLLQDGVFCTMLVHSDEDAAAMVATVYTFQSSDHFIQGRATLRPQDRSDVAR